MIYYWIQKVLCIAMLQTTVFSIKHPWKYLLNYIKVLDQRTRDTLATVFDLLESSFLISLITTNLVALRFTLGHWSISIWILSTIAVFTDPQLKQKLVHFLATWVLMRMLLILQSLTNRLLWTMFDQEWEEPICLLLDYRKLRYHVSTNEELRLTH